MTRVTSFVCFFLVLLFLTSIIRSVAMHAFVQEERIFSFVHEFKIIVLEEEDDDDDEGGAVT